MILLLQLSEPVREGLQGIAVGAGTLLIIAIFLLALFLVAVALLGGR